MSQQIKNNNNVDYDSYSSEDENVKTTAKKLNSSVTMINNKGGKNANRVSAPLLSAKKSLAQKRNKTITDKLYMPFITDKFFKIDVNNKLTRIKEDSKNNAIFNHKLIKKQEEVSKIGKQLFIYNNPSNFKSLIILKFRYQYK